MQTFGGTCDSSSAKTTKQHRCHNSMPYLTRHGSIALAMRIQEFTHCDGASV